MCGPVPDHEKGTRHENSIIDSSFCKHHGIRKRLSSQRVPPYNRDTVMRCAFCGYEFEEEKGIKGCKNCPTASGCKMVKCPRCKHENPPEPILVKRIKKYLKKLTRHKERVI